MRIYTYADPFNFMNKSDGIWDEIKTAPHLCASEVLVQGLNKHFGRDCFDCLLTIDEFLKKLFPHWLSNANEEVIRYQKISEVIDSIGEKKTLDEDEQAIVEAFKKNPKGIMEAVKFLIESEEIESVLEKGKVVYRLKDVSGYSKCERLFMEEVVNTILDQSNYNYQASEENVNSSWGAWIPDWDNNRRALRPLLDILRDCTIEEIRRNYQKEIGEEEKVQEEKALKWFEKNRRCFQKQGVERIYERYVLEASRNDLPQMIVFHGLYRMKPIHFKAIQVLEKNGIEVVLLNCYNKIYPKIYRHWEMLYKKLLSEDSMFEISDIKIGENRDTSYEPEYIGKLLGQLLEGNDVEDLSEKDLSNVEFVKYNSSMEFISYVFNEFEQTKLQLENENKMSDEQSVIAHMKEQFYGVNGTDLNQIFMVFYPELFKKKTFMTYPSGQFLYYLHDMWDEKEECLVYNHRGLVECMNMFDTNAIQVYEQINTYIGLKRSQKGMSKDEILKKIEMLKSMVKKDKRVQDMNLKHFGYILEHEEYASFISALEELEMFAKTIFQMKEEKNFGEYYRNVLNNISKLNHYKNWKALSQKENELVKFIQGRLNNENFEENVSSVKVMKEGINLYLGAGQGENINWLVRDFDQIDGDLYLYDNNKKGAYTNSEIIHFALVSNENLLGKENLYMPWPVSKRMMSNIWLFDTLKQISENRANYNIGMLFQGLYFLRPYSKTGRVKIRVSYVENNIKLSNNEESYQNEFFLFEFIRKKYKIKLKTNYEVYISKDDYKQHKSGKHDEMIHVNIDQKYFTKEALQVFNMCPRRYFYSIALDKNPYEYGNSEFQVKKFFQEYIKEIICDKTRDKGRLLKMSEKLVGDIMSRKEIEEIVTQEINAYLAQTKKWPFNPAIPRYWSRNVDEQDKPANYPKMLKPYYNRVEKEYLVDTIKSVADGYRYCDDEYRTSEYMCEYCSQQAICLYKYRLETEYLLRKEE